MATCFSILQFFCARVILKGQWYLCKSIPSWSFWFKREVPLAEGLLMIFSGDSTPKFDAIKAPDTKTGEKKDFKTEETSISFVTVHCDRAKISVRLKLYSHRESVHGKTRQRLLLTWPLCHHWNLTLARNEREIEYFMKWLLIVCSASTTNGPDVYCHGTINEYGGIPTQGLAQGL